MPELVAIATSIFFEYFAIVLVVILRMRQVNNYNQSAGKSYYRLFQMVLAQLRRKVIETETYHRCVLSLCPMLRHK